MFGAETLGLGALGREVTGGTFRVVGACGTRAVFGICGALVRIAAAGSALAR